MAFKTAEPTISIPLSQAALIYCSFLPLNPNKLRSPRDPKLRARLRTACAEFRENIASHARGQPIQTLIKS